MNFKQSIKTGPSRILIIATLFFLMSAVCAYADTYYVSPNGSNTWSQAVNRSSPSSASVAMANASAGDVVIFLNGTYNVGARTGGYEHNALEPSRSGSSTSPITFRAENTLSAELHGNNNSGEVEATVIGVYGRSYIVFDGFRVTAEDIDSGAPLHAKMGIREASNITIKNCEIVGAAANTSHSYNIEGVRVENAQDVTVQNCVIHGFIHTGDDHNVSGYKSYNSTRSIVENCTFYDNTVGIYDKERGNTNTYRKNIIRNSRIGILIQSAIYNSDNHKIYQNVFAHLDHAAFEKMAGDNREADNIQVYNNVFYYTSMGVNYSEGDNWQFWNNIYYGIGNRTLAGTGAKGIPTASDHNLYYNGSSFVVRLYTSSQENYSSVSDFNANGDLAGGSSPEVGSLSQNPMFVNPSNNDFRLQNGSPCEGAGRDGKDLGVYPNGNDDGTIIGYSGSFVPAPRYLRLASAQ